MGSVQSCPNCGTKVNVEAIGCPECGYNFVTKVAPAPPQPMSLEAHYGAVNPALVCPHCQTRGQVRLLQVRLKKGISGAKATGAVLTGGFSVLATGLSKKEEFTQAHCDNCSVTWHFQ